MGHPCQFCERTFSQKFNRDLHENQGCHKRLVQNKADTISGDSPVTFVQANADEEHIENLRQDDEEQEDEYDDDDADDIDEKDESEDEDNDENDEGDESTDSACSSQTAFVLSVLILHICSEMVLDPACVQ